MSFMRSMLGNTSQVQSPVAVIVSPCGTPGWHMQCTRQLFPKFCLRAHEEASETQECGLYTGDEGSAWSPTAAYQPQHHMQAGYSPGQEGYPPSQAPGPGGAVGYGHDQEQCYTYTGAGQAEAGLPGPSRLADRYIMSLSLLHVVQG